MDRANRIIILGVFVADTAYRADRAPRMGETILGRSFALGPGGKGSNQAVAAARLGAEVGFITRLGDDAFAEIAERTWAAAGVRPLVTRDADSYTGAAYIFIEEGSGDNAIIICPGAAARIAPADIDARRAEIEAAAVFVTQLEQPAEAAHRALEIARAAGVATVFNPAPAAPVAQPETPVKGLGMAPGARRPGARKATTETAAPAEPAATEPAATAPAATEPGATGPAEPAAPEPASPGESETPAVAAAGNA